MNRRLPILKYEAFHSDIDSNMVKPSKATISKWFKDTPKWLSPFPPKSAQEAIPTVKMCTPFLEAMALGYLIHLPMDVVVSIENEVQNLSWRIGGDLVGVRDEDKISYLPHPIGCSPTHYTWKLPLSFSVPTGYSVLYTQPFNRPELPFITLSGVIDGPFVTSVGGSIPFYLKKDFEGVIPQGTPLAQLVPFKNEKWEARETKGLIQEGNENSRKSKAVLSGWYKSAYWKKKSFN